MLVIPRRRCCLERQQVLHLVEHLWRRDLRDAGHTLGAFLRVVMQRTARAGHLAADDDAGLLLSPFVPADAGGVDADDLRATQRSQVLRAGVVAYEDGAERQERIELVKGERLVHVDDLAALQRVLRQLALRDVALCEENHLHAKLVDDLRGQFGVVRPLGEFDARTAMQNDVVLVLGEAQGRQQAATEVLSADDPGAAVQPQG